MGWESLPGTSTPAYYENLYFTYVKSFITSGPDCFILINHQNEKNTEVISSKIKTAATPFILTQSETCDNFGLFAADNFHVIII